jgi:hypothetical protein
LRARKEGGGRPGIKLAPRTAPRPEVSASPDAPAQAVRPPTVPGLKAGGWREREAARLAAQGTGEASDFTSSRDRAESPAAPAAEAEAPKRSGSGYLPPALRNAARADSARGESRSPGPVADGASGAGGKWVPRSRGGGAAGRETGRDIGRDSGRAPTRDDSREPRAEGRWR